MKFRITGPRASSLSSHVVAVAITAALGVAACASHQEEGSSASEADELATMAIPGVDESALNRAIDPCTDFYEFACGGYLASLPPETTDASRSFGQLAASRQETLARVIEVLRIAPRTDPERKASAYFQSCQAEDGGPKTKAFLDTMVSEIKLATTPAALARVVAKMHRQFISPFFNFSPTADTLRNGRHGSAMAYPGGADEQTDYTTEEGRAKRTQALQAALIARNPELTEQAAKATADLAVRVEVAISQAIAASSAGEKTHPLGRHGLEAATPHFDWSAYFEVLGGKNLGDFPVEGLGYFAALDDVLTKRSSEELQAYLTTQWYEAMAATPAPGPARDRQCTGSVSYWMSDAIETPFLQLAGVDARAQSKAKTMFRAILDSFGEQLKTEPLLDVPTRIEAQVKLARMRAAIGASRDLDEYDDVTADASESYYVVRTRAREHMFARDLARVGKQLPLLHVGFPAPSVNASADFSLNTINVPGGILGGYFFSPAAPMLANLAAIGTVLGHEVTHHFDNSGRQFDANGVMRDWWTTQVSTEFDRRAQCMIDQYGAVSYEGVPDAVTGVAPARINGNLTLGENIADNGGLKISYRAAKVDGRLGPVVSGFTPAQQFFVGYGQLWCEKTSPESLAGQLAFDPHSPGKARVNVTLSNNEQFSAAFKCQAGSTMAPANRCSVW